MSHDVITPDFAPSKKVFGPNDPVILDLNIINITTHIYKNTHVLYKVFYYDKESLSADTKKPEGRLIDAFISKDGYDVAPGSTSTVQFVWEKKEDRPEGRYRVEAYVVQNGIHVINDFARMSSYTNRYFEIKDTGVKETDVTIRKEKAYFTNDDVFYPIDRLKLFAADDNRDLTFTVVVRNDGKEDVEAEYNWKVQPYGKFDDSLNFVSTSSKVVLKAKKETEITVPITNKPSNRYHAIFELKNGNQKSVEIFRWARMGDVPSLIDTYGVIESSNNHIATTTGSDQFALKKGHKYTAFACLIGGFNKTNTTLTMRILDEDNEIIFSKEESKSVGITVGAFEYEFMPKEDTSKFRLEITSNAGGMIEKATWANDCTHNKSAECQVKSFPYIKYLLGILIIGAIFGLYYFIRKTHAHNQNEVQK